MNQELISKVNHRIEAAYQMAEAKFNRTFPRPLVEYTRIGTKAGTAWWPTNKVVYNSTLLAENTDAFIADTVPHEVGHLITNQVYPRAKAHGAEWKYVCRVIGMTKVTRCHSFDVTTARVRRDTRTEVVFCNCDTHKVTPRAYSRILCGIKYICKNCRSHCRAM